MGLRTIEQKMDNSSVWDGAAPAGNPVLGNDMESFAEGTAGGLFDFENTAPIIVRQAILTFGSGTSDWTLVLVDKDDVEVEILAASDNLPVVASTHTTPLAGLIILQGQKLKLVSAGGPTTAARARITVDRQIIG